MASFFVKVEWRAPNKLRPVERHVGLCKAELKHNWPPLIRPPAAQTDSSRVTTEPLDRSHQLQESSDTEENCSIWQASRAKDVDEPYTQMLVQTQRQTASKRTHGRQKQAIQPLALHQTG